MRNRASLAVASIVLGLLVPARPASAHCDTLSGPVVTAARAALEKKSLEPLLKWVKPEAEPELTAAFRKAVTVRSGGGESRELADRYFFETAVRLHRAGEGAPYTGLKTEADDPAGLIASSDKALESGTATPLVRLVSEAITAGLRERHARVVEARRHADHDVEAGRRYVEAYVDYVHYVEAVQQLTAKGGHSVDPAAHRHEK